MRDAMKARRLKAETKASYEVLDWFVDGFFMDELGRREAEAAGRPAPEAAARKRRHEGIDAWTRHALEQYDLAFPDASDGAPLVAAPYQWSYRWVCPDSRSDRRGVKEYALTLWGRCLQSLDGSYREFRWPSHQLADRDGRRRERSDAERAVAAFITASADPGPLPRWLRVVEFGLCDGRPFPEPLFDGTPDEARQLFDTDGRGALTALLDGTRYNPGKACTSCDFTSICPEVRRADGLLGVRTPNRPHRTWSPTKAGSYRRCPARYFLRANNLPVDDMIERNAAAERGRAIHQVLAARHKAALAHRDTAVEGSCTSDVPANWAEGWALDEAELVLGTEMLRMHAGVCPMAHARAAGMQPEQMIVRSDADAAALILVQPDLLYLDGDSWVWREVKTASRKLALEELFRRYPQLAVGVELLARGELGGTRGRSRVELEILRPDAADIVPLDPFNPAIRDAAREALYETSEAWRADDLFVARPGKECASCEVARWCPSRLVGDETEGSVR